MTPYQTPYLARPDELLPLPPVAARAALAAAQLINYHERFAFSAKMLRLLGRVFRDGSRHLAAECVTSLPRHFSDTSRSRHLAAECAASCAEEDGRVLRRVDDMSEARLVGTSARLRQSTATRARTGRGGTRRRRGRRRAAGGG